MKNAILTISGGVLSIAAGTAGAQPSLLTGLANKTATASKQIVAPAEALSQSPTLSEAVLLSTNPFDSARKVWPDRVPPPPPPAPPPPEPVTEQDVQLYGVTIVGDIKRATLKIGKRFAGLSTDGRAFVNVSEGQPMGDFTVAKIMPSHIVLQATGGQQYVYFSKKSDRGTNVTSATVPAPVQSPIVPAAAAGAEANAQTPVTAGDAPVVPQPAPQAALASPSASGTITVDSAQPAAANAVAPGAISAPTNSLAAALAAARANAAAQSSSGKNTPVFGNPFHQKP